MTSNDSPVAIGFAQQLVAGADALRINVGPADYAGHGDTFHGWSGPARS